MQINFKKLKLEGPLLKVETKSGILGFCSRFSTVRSVKDVEILNSG